MTLCNVTHIDLGSHFESFYSSVVAVEPYIWVPDEHLHFY